MGLWSTTREFVATFFGQNKKVGKRSYAGAVHSRLTADWFASGTSADSEIRGSITALRNRSRQLCRDNDYARNGLRTLVVNVVGSGIPFQSQVKLKGSDNLDEATNSLIEQTWQGWGHKKYCDTAGRLSWAQIQQVALRTVAESGEVLIRKVRQSFGGSKIPFALELIEPDLLDENHSGNHLGNEIRMGVEIDRWNRPVAYWLKTRHPGDYQFNGATEAARLERIPADEIIHLFITDRPGQTRGVPWLHSGARRLNDLGAYEQAEIVSARGSASIMGFLESADPDSMVDDNENGQSITELSPGAIAKLAPGEKFNGFAPSRPTTGFEGFVRQALRGVASGLGISYENLSSDYSQSNYSSSRLALLSERDNYKVCQQWLIEELHQSVFESWLELAVMSGALNFKDYEINPNKYSNVKWQPRGWSWVDPQKEVNSAVTSINNGLSTITDELARQGLDIETVLKTRKRELDLAKSLDLVLFSPAQTPTVTVEELLATQVGGNQ
ncbi:phage portal protein [Dolichospermum sp. UHCC 0684]|uniref:phage portal protein n=1 Tax=unclassified Dolichospermum TaxID=2622029 RepID=UPI001445C5E2|nr:MULTISPECIES: phage portal protein [unclassified Dolichospermum]MEA5529011.1 phage portal protein [Dolichospermum sp. UHCC 0684]MTJ33997.1 phage portal protein [Dolichospermum sp. UHCC 0260]